MPPENCRLTKSRIASSSLRHSITSCAIFTAGQKSVSDLAECEKVSPPAVSRHVDDLVKMGLVERTRDTEDRRSIILGLTDQGQTIWNKMIERNHQLFSEKMRQLSTQEIETIIEGLELLYSAFTNQVLDNNCQANGGKHQHE